MMTSISEHLNPSQATEMLPSLGGKDLYAIKDAGFVMVGVGATFVDDNGRLLMLEHNASPKNSAGQLGTLSETVEYTRAADGTIIVETTADTLSRGVYQELGVSQPSELDLKAKRVGAWFLCRWPTGGRLAGQYGFGVCPVVHLGSEQSEELQDTFTGTEEISALRFMTLDEIASQTKVRSGTHVWLKDLVASGLLDTKPDELDLLRLPGPGPLDDAKDIVFDEIDL